MAAALTPAQFCADDIHPKAFFSFEALNVYGRSGMAMKLRGACSGSRQADHSGVCTQATSGLRSALA
jgi:hypothetical protein